MELAADIIYCHRKQCHARHASMKYSILLREDVGEVFSYTKAEAEVGQEILYKTAHIASDDVVKKLSKNALCRRQLQCPKRSLRDVSYD